jgi:thiol-disulfide isomerase/thioredoxin
MAAAGPMTTAPSGSVATSASPANPARSGAGAVPKPDAALRAVVDSLVAAETRVRWEPGPPDSAIARAARAGRPAFLDFFADWCVPCRWMDRAVYNDPLLAEGAEAVAMVRIDIERPEGRALAARYDVHQYPTLVYLGPDGRETLRWPGPLSLRDTRLNLGQISLPSSARRAVEAERARRPGDVAVQAQAMLWYGWRGEVERVRAIVDTLERRGVPRDRSALLQLNLAKAEEVAGRRERALAAYRRALELAPEDAFAWRSWLGVSTTLEAAGDRAGAEAAAREALARNPQPWLQARVARLELAARVPAPPTPPGVEG